MKIVDILSLWIIFQLLIIWYVSGILDYEVDKWTYDCWLNSDMSLSDYTTIWLLVPLTAFVSYSPITTKYCNEKANDSFKEFARWQLQK